jgi:hypothetical protein
MNDMFRPEGTKTVEADATSRASVAQNGRMGGRPPSSNNDIDKPAGSEEENQPGKFDWKRDSDAIVCQKQPRTAVYENSRDQVVIRQEANWDEQDDSYVVFNKSTIPDLIRSLADQIDKNCWHAIHGTLAGMGM